jgi:hypothetical protein
MVAAAIVEATVGHPVVVNAKSVMGHSVPAGVVYDISPLISRHGVDADIFTGGDDDSFMMVDVDECGCG